MRHTRLNIKGRRLKMKNKWIKLVSLMLVVLMFCALHGTRRQQ